MKPVIYGIPNCDTIRKTKQWLKKHNIQYIFHDLRKDGLDGDMLASWIDELGWETLLNKRGMMWRKLSAKEKQNLSTSSVTNIMLNEPAIIKRPVLYTGHKHHIGFDERIYLSIFKLKQQE